MRSMKFRSFLSVFSVVPLACLGCEAAGAPELAIEEAWVRAALLFEEWSNANSAVYLILRNTGGGSDALLGGETAEAARVELHESRLDGEVMRMRKVDRLELPSGESVQLEPGGFHLMLFGLRRSLIEGDSIPLSLDFERSGRIELFVPVRRSGRR
jgi:copper(I)-binding protein